MDVYTLEPEGIASFRHMIFSWWKGAARDLPWRHTRDPYLILVSEVMLQQTQVARVITKYLQFTHDYPDAASLAAAPAADIIRSWKGLGYNRRALYLQHAAREVTDNFGGVFPAEEAALRTLPGIGPYTARAIMVFAFEADVGMVDTNIRQILVRHFFGGQPQPEGTIRKTADLLVPRGQSWAWHQALMDYGALVVTKEAKPQTSPRRRAVPFKHTDRYVRGRIMDAVREREWDREDLASAAVAETGRERPDIERALTGLVRDGLLVEDGPVVRLP